MWDEKDFVEQHMKRFLFVSAGRWRHLLGASEVLLVWCVFAIFSLSSLWLQANSNAATDSSNSLYLNTIINATVFTIVIVISMISVGLYNARLRETFTGLINRLIVSFLICIAVFAVIGLLPIFNIQFSIPPFAATLTAILVILSFRFIVSLILGETAFKTRVLVLGTGQRAQVIEKRMRRNADRKAFELIGFYAMPGDTEHFIDNDKILNFNDSLEKWVLQNKITEIVIACDERRSQLPIDSLFQCRLNGVSIIDIPDFIERETGQVAVNMLYPSWMLFSSGFDYSNPIRTLMGRVIDIFLSLCILAITWPIMLITALIIYLEDGGPVFFSQRRVGYRGKEFKILKFRSMRVDAEKNGAMWATKNDSRTTKIGNIIRKYRIDELPQLANVIVGEMCFVGPRPERPEFVSQLVKNIPYYNERHNVKPGLTGWAQLRYSYGASEEDALEKLKFDLYYIKNRSILLDVLIFFQTVEVVLFAKGSR